MSNEDMNDQSNDQNEELELKSEENTPVSDEQTEDTIDSSEGVEEVVDGLQLEKAKSNGYLTKEEYVKKHGTDKGFKSPEQFNEFGDSYAKRAEESYKELTKKLERLEATNTALVEFNKITRDREYTKARAELEAQMKQAKESGDVEGVEYLTEQKQKLNTKQQQKEFEEQQQAERETELEFIDRNKHWFNADHDDLINEARMVIQQYWQQYPKATLAQISYSTEQEMIRRHPDVCSKPKAIEPPRFNTSNVTKTAHTAAPVDDVSRTFKTLSKEDKQMFEDTRAMLKKSNIEYTQKDFLESMKNMRF